MVSRSLARAFGQLDPDRDLPVAEREFGEVLRHVADRRDADRLAERLHRHAHLRGDVEVRLDDDLGPLQVGVDVGVAQRGQRLHPRDDAVGRLVQRGRIVADENDVDVIAAETAGLRLEVDAGVGQRAERRGHVAFEIDRRQRAAWHGGRG